ncbi:MAG: TIGR00153 family protein [Candidatus Eisenbacteria bacterium]
MKAFRAMLTKSPFGIVNEHMEKVQECVRHVKPLFEAMLREDYEEVNHLAELVSRLEHEADITKNEIRNRLPRSIFLAVDRSDLLALLKEQDGIADSAEDVAVLLTMRLMKVPPDFAPKLLALVDKVVEASSLAGEAVAEMHNMTSGQGPGLETEKILKTVSDIGTKEWEADTYQMDLAKNMFALEKRIDPVSVMIWMRVFAELGALANRAENVGDLLRLMISER